jgi:hypothetical protein
MLNYYSIFHLNLMFSSLEENQRSMVVEKCYWPLLTLADEGYKLGIELTGITLEHINVIDPEWVKRLKILLSENKVELIGSGFSQIIGPLVPAEVNNWNQKLGLDIYEKILGTRPKIALVNEMAYSAGLVEHYANNNYKSIIMEWNNPRSGHAEWKNDWRYYPQYAVQNESMKIPVIWADSIAFQKFQRYAHNQLEFSDYVGYLKSQANDDNRYFPLYTSDAEIFDFRPGRYHTEALFQGESEWVRIQRLYHYLNSQDWCELMLPSHVLAGEKHTHGGNNLRLESTDQPIPVKKQEKYNINRWALTGRDDYSLNRGCYRIYKYYLMNSVTDSESWKELCYLWSSDFRTHLTSLRWEHLYQRMSKYSMNNSPSIPLRFPDRKNEFLKVKPPFKNQKYYIGYKKKHINIVNSNWEIELAPKTGNTIYSCIIPQLSNISLFGTLEHGFYDEISLGADYYSGHALVSQPAKYKSSDLIPVEPLFESNSDELIISSDVKNETTQFTTQYRMSNNYLEIKKRISLPKRNVAVINPIHLTFNPIAWDFGTLFIKTKNGGLSYERFNLGSRSIRHQILYSQIISAVHSFGATNGRVIIGDKDKQLLIEHDPSVGYILPRITFLPLSSQSYFFRISYSAQEIDETFKVNDLPQELDIKLKISVAS